MRGWFSLQLEMFSSTPGVNDQTVIMAAIGGFCRRVESGPSFCRNGPLPPSLAAHLISSSIVRVWVSPSRSQSLPQWPLSPDSGSGWDVLHPSPATRTSPARSRPPQCAVSSKNWPCVSLQLRRRDSRLGRSLWHRIRMTTRKWSLFGVINMVPAGFECIVRLWLPRHAVMLCANVMFSVCSLGPGAA